jgi:thiol-disulfide isomerase/thioredoxin
MASNSQNILTPDRNGSKLGVELNDNKNERSKVMKEKTSHLIIAQAKSWLAASTVLLFLFSTGCATNDMKARSRTSVKLGCEYPVELLQPAAWKASWSPDNQRLAYGKQGGGISVFDLATHRVTDLVPKGQDPAWSTDAKFIAYVTAGSQEYLSEEVWMVPASGGDPVKVGDGGFPTWSADGSQVIYHSRKLNQILSAKVNALDEPPAVFFEKPLSWYPAISPDSSRIAFGVQDKLVVVERTTGKTLASLPTPGERGLLPCWSPDGRRVAFGGFAGNRAGLWIFDVERGGAFQVAKNPGCTMPAWSPDCKSLAFDLRGSTNEIWLVKTKDLPRNPPLTKQLPSPPTQAPAARERLGASLVGKPVPQSFKLALLDGGEFILPDSSNTNILLLDFWATWCGPCRQVMPTLAEISQEYAARGVLYVAVNLREQPETIRHYLDKAGLKILVALDTDGKMAEAFHVQGIPTMVVVDQNHIIRKVHVGASPTTRDDVRGALDEVLRADISSKDANGMTPLHMAAAKGQRDDVERLLASGADVNAKAKDGATPLHWAVYNGHKDITELLLANKAPVNARGRDGYTPLHWAAARGFKEIAELLLNHQADVNAKDNKGETPLQLAQSKNHTDVVELLRQHGGK